MHNWTKSSRSGITWFLVIPGKVLSKIKNIRFGYKGKQVRDNIHAYDLVTMFWEFYKNPGYGEIYNAGGGRSNSISIIEAINLTSKLINQDYKNFKIMKHNRKGDHIWYITDFSKFKKKYNNWKISKI